MHVYNIGVSTGDEMIGFHVTAANMDEAYEYVLSYCESVDIALHPGHTAQRRDPNASNQWFDRTFRFVRALGKGQL